VADHDLETGGLSREEMQSALFAQLVMQQSNLAFMLLGKVPHPESGQSLRDLDTAKLFIDQLEMLEAKTKGNLNPRETALLKQNLMSLRLAFVEAVNSPAPKPAAPAATPAADKTAADLKEKSPPAEVAGGEEGAKRFSKKYS
jgi:hypothetical protein